MNKTAYVYRHIRLDKNCPFYIGVGGLTNFDNYRRAFRKTYRNAYWTNIINKTDYTVEIILDNLTEKEAFLKEKEFIDFYGIENLANLTRGGDGVAGYKHSITTKSKIGAKSIGRKHIKSISCREKMSQLAKDRKFGGKKKAILQFTKSGEFIKEWESLTDLSKNGYSMTAVIEVCKGKPHRKTHKKYVWKYKNM